jgi:cation transport ATPase
MWMAVVAHMGASLVVVANGLRLLRADQAAEDRKMIPTPFDY